MSTGPGAAAPLRPHGAGATAPLRPHGAGEPGPALLTDAVRTLTTWPAPDESQARMRERYLRFLGEHPGAIGRAERLGHLTASTLLLDDARERVLLTLHPMAGRWFQLGGHLEPTDATVAAAAHREAMEESGFAALALNPVPLQLDWHQVTCRDALGQPGPSQHLDIEHLAIAAPGSEPVRTDESLDLAWFPIDALPDQGDAVVPTLVRRARALGLA